MRKLLAALLLFCVGIMIPASASHVRICFLELGLNSIQEDSKCCEDCSRETEHPDPCCHDLEKLPDSGIPQNPIELPPMVVADLPEPVCLVPLMIPLSGGRHAMTTPIRGPTSPAAYRAVLGIWRL